ncbi:major facilitator superfamily domain-containing protein [Cladorrhinum sp. PSN259]|nr:major facilitator superfamily domain-containing protein [Cladorrhinum sp. PSN259]
MTEIRDHDSDIETAALLGGPSDDHPAALEEPLGPKPMSVKSILFTMLTSAGVVFLLDIGNSLSLAPQTAILESIVCQRYYERLHGQLNWQYQGNVSVISWGAGGTDKDCKIGPIQSQVAFINGWKDVCETLPGILFAVPFGILADRWGRKGVMLMAVLGLVLADGWVRFVYWFPNFFPLWSVWLGGWLQVIGAGGTTLSSMVFAQLADVCPAEQRTAAFSILASSTLLSQLIFVPVGAALMDWLSPWVPMFLTSGLGILGLVVAWIYVPETKPITSEDEDQDEERRDSEWFQLRELGMKGKELARGFVKNRSAALVLVSTFCFSLAIMSDSSLLLQYVSKRLGWTIGEAAILLSVRAGVGLLVLAVLLPLASSFFLVRLNLHEGLKDKRIAQASGVFLSVGAATLFLGNSWILLFAGQILFAVGFAYTATTRSLLASTVDETQRATAFTALTVFMQAGFLIGSPLLAAAFTWGLKLGEAWSGMPFLVAAGVSVVGTMAVSAISVRGGGEERVITLG